MVSARCIIDTNSRNTGAISAECDKTLMVSTLHSISPLWWASASVDVLALDGIAYAGRHGPVRDISRPLGNLSPFRIIP